MCHRAGASNRPLNPLDVAGRRVRTLLDRARLAAGPHEVTMDAGRLRGGMYWCRLDVNGRRTSRRMVLLGR